MPVGAHNNAREKKEKMKVAGWLGGKEGGNSVDGRMGKVSVREGGSCRIAGK